MGSKDIVKQPAERILSPDEIFRETISIDKMIENRRKAVKKMLRKA